MLNIDQTSINAAEINGRRRLFCAVIFQAIEDARGDSTDLNTPTARERAIQQARRWLTVPNRDFNTTCHLADLDPERVRAEAKRLIAEADQGIVQPKPDKTKPARKPPLFSTLITHNGETLTGCAWCARIGFTEKFVHRRVSNGMGLEDAIFTPKKVRVTKFDLHSRLTKVRDGLQKQLRATPPTFRTPPGRP